MCITQEFSTPGRVHINLQETPTENSKAWKQLNILFKNIDSGS
jgi:hypothetical protein